MVHRERASTEYASSIFPFASLAQTETSGSSSGDRSWRVLRLELRRGHRFEQAFDHEPRLGQILRDRRQRPTVVVDAPDALPLILNQVDVEITFGLEHLPVHERMVRREHEQSAGLEDAVQLAQRRAPVAYVMQH